MKIQKSTKKLRFLLILVVVAFAACKSNEKKEETPLNENQMNTMILNSLSYPLHNGLCIE